MSNILLNPEQRASKQIHKHLSNISNSEENSARVFEIIKLMLEALLDECAGCTLSMQITDIIIRTKIPESADLAFITLAASAFTKAIIKDRLAVTTTPEITVVKSLFMIAEGLETTSITPPDEDWVDAGLPGH